MAKKINMKIFIDFDDVLFNTKDFKEDLLAVFVKNGITKEQFKDSYWGKTYNLEKQIESIKKEYDVDSEKLEKDINSFLKDLKKYVFQDAHDFVEFVGKDYLFLASYGHKNFQYQKVKNAGLEDSFNQIVVTHNKKSEIIQNIIKEENLKDETLYFLDDRIRYIEEVRDVLPEIKTILMKRPEGRYDDEPNKYCDHVAKNLNEVSDIISKS